MFGYSALTSQLIVLPVQGMHEDNGLLVFGPSEYNSAQLIYPVKLIIRLPNEIILIIKSRRFWGLTRPPYSLYTTTRSWSDHGFHYQVDVCDRHTKSASAYNIL